MSPLNFPETVKIYDCGRHCVVTIHSVGHDLFRRYCLSLRTLLTNLGEASGDDFWRGLLWRPKRFRFDVTAAPVAFGNRLLMGEQYLDEIAAAFSRLRSLFPTYVDPAQEVLQLLKELASSRDNPMLSYVLQHGGGESNPRSRADEKTAFLVKEPRLIPIVEDELRRTCPEFSFEVVSEGLLRKSHYYEQLFVFGPGRWFSEYVFSAPRATRIRIVHYDWIPPEWKAAKSFVGGRTTKAHRTTRRRLLPLEKEGLLSELEIDDLLERVDLGRLGDQLSGDASTPEDPDEEALAYLFEVEGRSGVFLDAEGSIIVVDLEEEGESRVDRIEVREIEIGMFLVLRERGGGDLIVPVADKILAEQASHSRDVQQEWKKRLRGYVESEGMAVTCEQLQTGGAIRASEPNVRNWMSDRSIKTEDRRDFNAIMHLVDLTADDTWEIMERIHRAHRKAGGVIRRFLLNAVRSSDLRELERLGRKEFKLLEGAGGSMLVCRVVRLSRKLRRVALHQIGRHFALEDKWRG